MIVEFFGLSRTGKTTLKNSLLESPNQKKYVTIKSSSELIKFISFLKFLFSHPSKTSYLFFKLNSNYLKMEKFSLINYFKMIILRNSYLIGVLAKYGLIKQLEKQTNPNKRILIEEYMIQSIFMILHKKSNEREIKKLIRILPTPNQLLIFELENKTRLKRYQKTRYPAEQIERGYALRWMENTNFNYQILKNLLLNNKEIKSKLIDIEKINKENFIFEN